MTDLALGLDLGTSGLRSSVLDAQGRVISSARANYPAQDCESLDAETWWIGAVDCLRQQIGLLRDIGIEPDRVRRIAVDGTSGSLVLTDADLIPVTRALMYHHGGFDAEARAIAKVAPERHIACGADGALARALRLLAEDPENRARHLCHQADFVAARLCGVGGTGDWNNLLKTGFDPSAEAWPRWIAEILDPALLPRGVPPGAPIGVIGASAADATGLPQSCVVHAGTTDSIAAFLAAAPLRLGAAVTSLGTTLAIKMLVRARIDDPDRGLYSHRLGDHWLVGGASNTGGGVLASLFSNEELVDLSDAIDPTVESPLDYYPLIRPGERFPVRDPDLAPRLSPRPNDPAEFLHGVLESMARIERDAYAVIAEAGGTRPDQVLTAGGGSSNSTWMAIRSRVIGVPVVRALHAEASVGVARLALDAASSCQRDPA